jgi:hypothetical protein
MSVDTTLLGLPGLYQNWLLSALDTTAISSHDGAHNFISHSHKIKWLLKMDTDLSTVPTLTRTHKVINSYVTDENFVWYLYNFLEKTDGVGILIDNLISDLFSKAPGTIAFDGLLKHLVDSYQLTAEHDRTYMNNAAIENFYHLLINRDSQFKLKTSFVGSDCVNIEYRDFENIDTLISKLGSVNGFDEAHFRSKHQQLISRNTNYIHRQQNFINKLDSQEPKFDILETAYIGWLIWKLIPETLDWFNTDLRESKIKTHWSEICNLAKMFYNTHT